MKEEILKIYQQYFELLESIPYNPDILDYNVLDRHIEFLKKINIQDSSISIFDLYQKKHVYISSNFAGLLGWDITEAHEQGNAYMDERMHPDDAVTLTKAGIYFIQMGLELAKTDPKAVKDYKVLQDYRTKNKKNQFVRVIEQHKLLEFDSLDNPWLALCVMDISPDEDIITPGRARLLHTTTGEIYEFPGENPDVILHPVLSKREKEILGLIAIGNVSKQIADKLYISVNTVNTHRQRIIEKLNVSNTTQAVTYASRMGIID
jgi:DNA-binding CsgD family transcriptional regulator